jgi:hypothetical protein
VVRAVSAELDKDLIKVREWKKEVKETVNCRTWMTIDETIVWERERTATPIYWGPISAFVKEHNDVSVTNANTPFRTFGARICGSTFV